MSGDPDPLAVATQLRDLAADPLNRRAIVQDQGCLPGLILFLDHHDPQVVYAALLAVRYLAECRPNRDRLRAELGMMLSLQNLVHKTTTPGETRLLASEVYELLQAGPVQDQDQDQDQVQEPARTRRRAQFFLGSSNKRAKTLVLQVQGLEDPDLRSVCEEGLLRLRGVVSFTFQTASRRVVVRVRSDLQAEALAAAMGSTVAVQQVVRTQNGDEVLVPLSGSGSGPVQQNLDLPDYLPEDEGPDPAPDQALTRVGPGPDRTSWVGAAANFLSRSFYW